MSRHTAADPHPSAPPGAQALAVVIPAAQSALREVIAPGSGCVARRSGGGYLLDYEDNDQAVRRLGLFADRVAAAAVRAEDDAPTRARVFVLDEHELVIIGEFQAAAGRVTIRDRGALAAWLGEVHVADEELAVSAPAPSRDQMGLF